MNKQFVVIGASAASIAFIAKLRSFDKNSKILCFSAESDFPYNRCLLADFLTQELKEEQLHLKPESFFEQNNIDLFLNHQVTHIDFDAKKVLVKNDQEQAWHSYDYLFLGMGSGPIVPEFVQKNPAQGLFMFHTLDDMKKIDQWIATQKPKSAVVVGAGLNGIEAASALHDRGLAVGIVEKQNSMLPGQVDHQIAAWVTSFVQQKGIPFFSSRTMVQACVKNNQVQGVLLDSGSIIQADVVVVAIGSKVNSSLVKQSLMAMGDAGCVLVDDHLKTNLPDVFAGGDLCMVPDLVSKKLVRSTTWSDAMLQGLCAATNFDVKPRVYPGLIGLRDSHFFGLDFYACGQTIGHGADVVVHVASTQQAMKKVYLKNDQIVGFVLLGDISSLPKYKQWYVCQQKVDVEML